MRHFFLSEADYAASGHQIARALQVCGEQIESWTVRASVHQYPRYPRLLAEYGNKWDRAVQRMMMWCDWLWLVQSDVPRAMGGKYRQQPQAKHWMDWAPSIEVKRVAMTHGGSYYRRDREWYQQRWRPFDPVSFCYESDLMGGFEREHLLIPPVDMGQMPAAVRSEGRLRVGHFPGRPTDKGSEVILPVLAARDVDLRTSVTDVTQPTGATLVPWRDHLDRMAACDVIVDQIKPELDGARFGEWVSTATEAAAIGCISIANSLDPAPYVRTYGRMPGIHICNDADALGTGIDRLASLPPSALDDEKEAGRDWIKAHHTYGPTGELVMRLLRDAQ